MERSHAGGLPVAIALRNLTKETTMGTQHTESRGAGFRSLLMGGLLAGAVGLALSNQAGGYGSSAPGAMPPDPQTSQPTIGSTTDETLGAAAADLQATGWKIRVCPEKTKADRIDFKISQADKKEAGGKDASHKQKSTGKTDATEDQAYVPSVTQQTAMWSRGEATEITVPTEFSNLEKIKIEAAPGKEDQKASICILYGGHVAKKLSFDDREVSTIKKTETGECGC
jgi:hypothetical protein